MRRPWLAMIALALAATAVQAQTYKVLYNFGSHQGDPYRPYTGIITQGRDGSLYFSSRMTNSPNDIFKITPSGILSAVYGFSGQTNGIPAGVSLGTDGKLYGSIEGGLAGDRWGALVTLTPNGDLTTLYNFTGGADGGDPFAPPIQGIDGNFYGTTNTGGSLQSCYGGGCGTLYKITPSGTFSVLHKFLDSDGASVYAPLMQATNGDFYGTAYGNGGSMRGTVFRIDPSGKFLVVVAFNGITNGVYPQGGVIQGTDGSLYGTADNVFKITDGSLVVLRAFTYSDGVYPLAGLAQATDGNIYGTTLSFLGGCGTVFRISPAGDFATLYTFPSDGSLGCQPYATLTQHTNGKLYGTTNTGGSFNQGVFFSVDIGAAPFVTFLPAARQVGHTVEILGQGLTGTTAVSFNGTPATAFNVYANTYMTATVPAGATTGFITVTTPSGTLTSNKQFQVKPQIASFSPTSGPPGTSVVVTGVSLTQTSKITFNSVVATSFTVNSDSQVTVTVPAGATSSKIGVTTTGAPVYSPSAFTVTP